MITRPHCRFCVRVSAINTPALPLCLSVVMVLTIYSPNSDDESTIRQAHAAHAARGRAHLPEVTTRGGAPRRTIRAAALALGEAASSGSGVRRPALTNGSADAQEAPAQGTAGGVPPIAVAGRPEPEDVPQTAHALGLEMGIQESALSAVEQASGSDINMTLVQLANIPELFFMRALDKVRLTDSDLAPFSQALGEARVEESQPLAPVLAGTLISWWRRAQVMNPPELPRPPPQKIEITQKMLEEAPGQGAKRKMEGIIDQRDDTLYTPLSAADLAMMRLRFWKKTGDHPIESERPSDDQLTALAGRLIAGRSPWVDFSVWTPYGVRKTKENSFRPQVWVNGQLETKLIAGPPDHDAWLCNYKIFRTAMIMCRAASPAALDRYAHGIRQLLLRHPGGWGLIFVADEIARGEKWSRLMEEARADPYYDDSVPMPWEEIIKGSAWRVGSGTLQEFWDQHVLHPATMLNKESTPKGPAAAKQYIADVDGSTQPTQSIFDPNWGKDRKGKGVSPHWPEQLALPWTPPNPPGGPPANPPPAWTRKELVAWEKGKKGKGAKGKGKDGKGKGKKGEKAKAKAKAAALWQAWKGETGK